jgi:hypothetical protein
MRLAWVAAVALGLGLAGCSPSYVTGSDAPVNLIISDINGGGHIESDIRDGSNTTTGPGGTPETFICPDLAKVTVTVRNKNPNGPTGSPAGPSSVQLSSYEVRYTRTDGRGVEGIDVPYRITGNLAVTVDPAGTASWSLEVVRRQAKLEPPLSAINQTALLTAMAQVTLYGKTLAGQSVSATASFQIDFADFADKNTSCPTS